MATAKNRGKATGKINLAPEITVKRLLASVKKLERANAALLATNNELKNANEKLIAANKNTNCDCDCNSLMNVNETLKAREDKLLLALHKTEKLMDSVFHTADIGIAIIDAHGNFVKVNSGLCKLTGYAADELVGRKYTKIITFKDKKEVGAFQVKILKGATINVERKIVRKDGSIADSFVTNSMFTDEDGKKFIVKTFRDITESKKYQNLLQRVEENVHIGGFEHDVATNTTTWTDEIYNIFEVEKSFKPSLFSLNKYRTQADNIRIKKAVDKALQHGTGFKMDFAITTALKKNKWVRVTANPIRFKGKTIRLFSTVQDVTLQKDAETEIERLSWVARHTNNSVIITAGASKINWVNESFERMTGYTMEDVVGKMPGPLLDGQGTDKAVIKRMNSQIRRKKPVSEIILNYTKSGEPFWQNIDITPIFRDNKVINFIGIGTDLTALTAAQEAQNEQEGLLEQQKLFNAMSKNFPDGIIGVIDTDYNYVFVGGRELNKMGLNRHSLIGGKIFDSLWPDADHAAEPYLARAFKGEKVVFELRIGTGIYSIAAVPLIEKDAPITQVLVVIQNITEQKHIEEEMVKTIAKQKELNDLKSKFVTIASHEFRTPLSTILSSSYLIEMYNTPEDEDKKIKHINRVRSAVANLTEILNEFLSVGKIEDGVLRNKPELFDIQAFCGELVEDMSAYAKKGQVIKYEHNGGTDLVSLDRQHLKNVLINLLSNAIKYSEQGKLIELSSKIGKECVRVAVKDNGMGIPEEDRVHLFETFFRAKNATNIQGTGMGLHIVKRYLDIMGGKIELQSKLKQGSVFTVCFPQQTPEVTPVA